MDYWISTLQNSLNDLAKDEANAEFAYVTFEDIKALGSEDQNPFLVIKAPKGTTLEVPTTENENLGENKYQLFLKSPNGEISVYYVSGEANPPK